MPKKRKGSKPRPDPSAQIAEIFGLAQREDLSSARRASDRPPTASGAPANSSSVAEMLFAQIRLLEEQRDGAEDLLRAILSTCQSLIAKINSHLLADENRKDLGS
jgi:hypothetical protein